MAKYYGQKEVEKIGDVKESGLVDVTFKDGSVEELPQHNIPEIITDEPLDATALRDKRCFPVVAEILKVLLNANVHIDEIDFIAQRVIMSINESLKKGSEILWGASEDEKTMSHVQKVLMNTKVDGTPSPYQEVKE